MPYANSFLDRVTRILPQTSARLLKGERMKKSRESGQLTDGDQEAFHELYIKYHHRVYSTCLRMTRNVYEYEDLTQDIFIHLFRTIGTFRGEAAFTTLLHRVTINHVLMHLRRSKRQAEQTTESGELPACVATGSLYCRVPFDPATVLTPTLLAALIALSLLALVPVAARRLLWRRVEPERS